LGIIINDIARALTSILVWTDLTAVINEISRPVLLCDQDDHSLPFVSV